MGIISLFKKITSLRQKDKQDFFWLYIQCNNCAEKIKVGVSRRFDLQDQYLKPGQPGAAYILKKEVNGRNCFNLMEVYMEFDSKGEVISRHVENGKFIDKEEVQA